MSDRTWVGGFPSRFQRAAARVGEVATDHKILSSLAAILAFTLFTGDWSLSSYIVMYGLFAVAYNFCLGQTGLLSFGHAAFFGLGAYGYGIVVVTAGLTGYAAWLGVLTGVGAAVLGGLLVGLLALRLRGTYLALATLAVAQTFWYAAFQLRSWTGGDDGLIGVERPELAIPGLFDITLADPMMFFFFALVVLGLSMVVIDRLRNSNFGRVLVAIRENENRAKFLGYNTYHYKTGAFVVSAGFSGLAGVLYPLFLSIVSLQTLHWLLSGEVNFWVILGGLHTFVGPLLGTAVYVVLKETSSQLTSLWRMPVGALIILMVLYAPEGMLVRIRKYLMEGSTR